MESHEATPNPLSIQSYLDTFGDRLTTEPHKFEYKGKYEGIYGYIWNDYRIEVVTETITTKTTTILGQQ
jgi:hypothetical protein